MNPRQVFIATVAIAALSSAGLVAAQEATQVAWPDSTRTRAEISAELAQARKDGSIKVRSITYGQPAASAESRDEVQAELAQAKKDGSIKVRSITYGQPASSTKSREEVRAEMVAASAGAGLLHRKAY
jgi:hypothetical protein